MNAYNFHNEIDTNLKMFISALDDTVIKRYDAVTGVVKDSIKVNYTFSPKSRVFADLKGQADTIKFPIVALTVKGINRDNSRVKNKFEEFVYEDEDGSLLRLRKVPVNINVEMTIVTKFAGDLDQILQNFAVFFDPYIAYSWSEPKSGLEVRTETFWDGNISIEYPTEVQHNEYFRNIATTSFTIKTWMYRSSLTPIHKICKINADYIFTKDFHCNYQTLKDSTNENQTDSYTISGRPIIRYVSPYYIKSGQDYEIKIQGSNLNNIESLYVSASNGTYNLTEYDPLSSGTLAFNGLLIDEFKKNGDTITFNLPSASGLGFIDIIAVNDCGYGKLSEDSNRCNRVENPYPTDDPEHYSWCAYQFPYINGLILTEDHNTLIQDQTKQIITFEEEPLDRDAILSKIRELMELGNISVDDL